MPDFRLVAPFEPTGDQPQAIDRLVDGLSRGLRHQTLLGVTGSGKSLPPDEPVLVGRVGELGQIDWSLEAIGDVVDEALDQGELSADTRGTEIADGSSIETFVVALDPLTHRTVAARVTAFTRHIAPATMWTVTTDDGRSVTVTGDHNFFRLGGDHRLELAESSALAIGDAIPLPDRTPGPVDGDALTRLDTWDAIDIDRAWVTGPDVLGVEGVVSEGKALEGQWRAHLRDVGRGGVTVMERHGDTVISRAKGRHRLPASRPLDAPFLQFLGLFVAEGHVADGYALLTPGPENDNLAGAILDACVIPWRRRVPGDFTLPASVTHDQMLVLCGARASEKHLPPFWSRLDTERLGQLLAGYFEGDGWVEAGCVAAVTKSERLASEVSYALLRFGIVGRISRTFKRAVGTDHEGAWYWQVAVRGREDVQAFADNVGFLSGRKRSELAAMAAQLIGGNADVLPGRPGELLRAVRIAVGARQRDLADVVGMTRSGISLLESGDRALRRGTARRLYAALAARAQATGSGEALEPLAALERLLACRWARVRSVEPHPSTSEHVYDFSVEGCETFLAGRGGMFVHNTYTMAQTIVRHNKPTLVLAHNKTLAAQLYSEFREFFPDNAVEYFVSYFDYYQPEAYLPRSDTYIEKDSSRNEEIDRLRHAATHALFERRDVIIVASVSCIYGLGAPVDYGATILRLRTGGQYRRDAVLRHLVDLQYQRNDAAPDARPVPRPR